MQTARRVRRRVSGFHELNSVPGKHTCRKGRRNGARLETRVTVTAYAALQFDRQATDQPGTTKAAASIDSNTFVQKPSNCAFCTESKAETKVHMSTKHHTKETQGWKNHICNHICNHSCECHFGIAGLIGRLRHTLGSLPEAHVQHMAP